ncbi:MAG TPA: sigma-70 family RNA polymerase sigma factor [Gaiellaceae bacterium]|nr:sigma-70 family RNA polymerase sigma factor [Gaiellaceae bacterium]
MTGGDDDPLTAIEAVYRERFPRFVQVGEAVCGDPELAREAVQRGCADAIRGRSRPGGEAAIETWLWAAVLEALAGLERGRRESRGEPAAPATDLPLALGGLATRERQLLFLRYLGGLGDAAIAEVLELDEATAAAGLEQAETTLRHLLDEVAA